MKLDNMIGRDIMTAMIEDSFLPNPINLETVMQMPDLLTPGNNDKDWKIASFNTSLYLMILWDVFSLKSAINSKIAKKKFSHANS